MATDKIPPSSKHRNRISHERLLELLNYEPDTGLFRRRKSKGGYLDGSVAGSISAKGYVTIMIDYKNFYAHVLAWFYVTGTWPEDQIDHRDLNKTNNRFSNLRPADNSTNHANSVPRKDNTSGYKGVSWANREKRWVAYISVNKRRVTLGYYKVKEDAAKAYQQAAIQHFGEYARVS